MAAVSIADNDVTVIPNRAQRSDTEETSILACKRLIWRWRVLRIRL